MFIIIKSMKRNKWERIVEYIDYNRRNIIINLIIFSSIVFVLLLIDLLTKGLLFEWENGQGKNQTGGVQHVNALFGIRSVSNSGLTWGGNIFPTWVIHLFNIIILLACFFFLIILKSHVFAISIAFIFAGTMGNMIDRMTFSGKVRDIIFIPWADNGTFNFADVDAILGAIMTLIYFVWQIFQSSERK